MAANRHSKGIAKAEQGQSKKKQGTRAETRQSKGRAEASQRQSKVRAKAEQGQKIVTKVTSL